MRELKKFGNTLHPEGSRVAAKDAVETKVVEADLDATRTSTVCLQHCHVLFLKVFRL